MTLGKGNKGIGYYNPHRDDESLEAHPQGLDKPSQPDIAHSLGPIDTEDANVEAEKDEVVLKPDLMGMYKVKGKTHKQGGTPLSLEEGSFIFSNDPKLAIDKEEAEVFDFEEPTSTSDRKNTPAKALLREVAPKEYNSLVNTLTDPDADKISKITAALMLEKYHKTIGRMAFLQETKKDEPVPAFAMGTAPSFLYDDDQLEAEEDMFAKKGGMYAPGGPIKPYRGARTKAGRYTPTGRDSRYDFPYGDPRDQGVEKLAAAWDRVGLNIRNMTEGEAQSAMYDWALKNNPEQLQTMWADWGMTAKGIKQGLNTDDTSIGNLANLKPGFVDNIFGGRQFNPITRRPKASIPTAQPVSTGQIGDRPTIPAPQAPTTAPTVSSPEQIPSLGYEIKGKLTNPQLAHLSMLGLNAMSINKYYPKREQVDLPEVNLDLINEQPYMNDINNQSFQAYRAAANGDPRMARVNASNIYGRGLDAMSKTRGNIQNQNTQIQNQENLTNLQQRTNQVLTNTQYDDRYFDQVQTVRENYDKEKRYANNAVMSQLNQYQSQADQLAWGLASVNKYGRRLVVDPKTGKKYYKPVPLYEATQSGINYNADVADLNLASGTDRLNTIQETIDVLKQNGINTSDPKLLYAYGRLLGSLGAQKSPIYATNPTGPNQ